jgi:hypothetical protein
LGYGGEDLGRIFDSGAVGTKKVAAQ